MSTIRFIYCSECGRRLQATFFCQGCGRPCCSLDCYCRHEAAHVGRPEKSQAHPKANLPSGVSQMKGINSFAEPTWGGR